MNKKNSAAGDKLGKFSVGLGLLDYVNPVCLIVNTVLWLLNLRASMNAIELLLFICGISFSLVFGFTIPTVKVLVGLGKMEFKLPIKFVFYVNLGLLLAGGTLLWVCDVANPAVRVCMHIGTIAVLLAVWKKGRKMNNVALLTGGFGYVQIYISLLILTLRMGLTAPIFCFVFCLIDNVTLITLAMTKNLMNPKLHWMIESANITSQLVLTLGIFLLFY